MRHPLPEPSPASADERPIARIYDAPGLHMVGDGFRVRGYMGAYPELVRKLDPFLLIDYHPPYTYPPSGDHLRGVGSHPHRGFETVTLAFEGSVAHHDSTGGGGVIGPGDVQWMTAASGILHKEYHEAGFARAGGVFHMAQLWVNLPAAHKMGPPRYHAITAERIGRVALPGGAGEVRVVAGAHDGVVGPAETFSPIAMFDVGLNPGGEAPFAFPAAENVAVLVMAGEITINGGPTARADQLVLFANEGERFTVAAASAARLLLLAGEPIGEPIVQYGPFVMNTEREIADAIADFNAGKFGRLDD